MLEEPIFYIVYHLHYREPEIVYSGYDEETAFEFYKTTFWQAFFERSWLGTDGCTRYEIWNNTEGKWEDVKKRKG